MARRILLCALFGLALTLGGVQAQDTKKKPDLSGEWTCEGWNMGSDFSKKPDYTIKVQVSAKGNDTYLVAWKLSKGGSNVGVGLYDPQSNTFAAGYSVGRSPGVALFHIDDAAKVMTCRGTFQKMLGKVAQERWSR